MNLHQYPAVPPALAMACGILSVSCGEPAALAVAAVACVMAFLVSSRCHRLGYILPGVFALLGVVLTLTTAPPSAPADIFDGKEHTLRGRVVREQSYGGTQRLVVQSDSGALFRAVVSVSEPAIAFAEGDLVRAKGYFERPDAHSAIPFATRTNRSDRVSARMYAATEDVKAIGHSGGRPKARDAVISAIYGSPLSPGSASMLASAWLGDDAAAPEVRDNFRITGLAHLLCVSGFHLGLLAAVVSALTAWLYFFPRLRLLRHAVTITAAWAFAWLSGMQAPVIRAAVMLTVYLVARMAERGVRPLNSLAVSVIVILIINPWWIYAAGFQLSVAAVAGIILLAPRLNPVPMKKGSFVLHRACAMLAVPAAALIATAPIVLAHYHTLPLLSIPANALAALLFPPFMTTGALAVGLSVWGLCPHWLAQLTDALYHATASLCDAVASLAVHSVTDVYLSPLTITLMCVLVVLLTVGLHAPGRYRPVLCALALVCLSTAGCGRAPEREMAVYSDPYGRYVALRTPDTAIVAGRGRHIPYPLRRYFEAHGRTPALTDSDFTTPLAVRRGNMILAGGRTVDLSALPDTTYTSTF